MSELDKKPTYTIIIFSFWIRFLFPTTIFLETMNKHYIQTIIDTIFIICFIKYINYKMKYSTKAEFNFYVCIISQIFLQFLMILNDLCKIIFPSTPLLIIIYLIGFIIYLIQCYYISEFKKIQIFNTTKELKPNELGKILIQLDSFIQLDTSELELVDINHARDIQIINIEKLDNKNEIQIDFRIIKSGNYQLDIKYHSVAIKRQVQILIKSGEDDICFEKIQIHRIDKDETYLDSKIHVCELNEKPLQFGFEFYDNFDNPIHVTQSIHEFKVEISEPYSTFNSILIYENEAYKEDDLNLRFGELPLHTSSAEIKSSIFINIPFYQEGIYFITISFRNTIIHEFRCVVLHSNVLQEITSSPCLKIKSSILNGKKNCFILITPTQIFVKEYILMGWIPFRKLNSWGLNSSFSIDKISNYKSKKDQLICKLGNSNEFCSFIMDEKNYLKFLACFNVHLQKKYLTSSFEYRLDYARSEINKSIARNSSYVTIDREFILRDGCKLLLKLNRKYKNLIITYRVCFVFCFVF